MDDELEDRVLYQTYLSYMKLMSKLAVGLPTCLTNAPFVYFWKMLRYYALRPEFLAFGAAMVVILFYLQASEIWSRSLIGKIHYTLGKTSSKVSKLQFLVTNAAGSSDKLNWEFKEDHVAAFALQGHRAHMEDRFVVNNNINNTGVSLFAVFDGHGGEFAADYAKDKLIPNINKKVVELKGILSGNQVVPNVDEPELSTNKVDDAEKDVNGYIERKKSLRKSASQTDDCMKDKNITDPFLLDKLNSLTRSITREVRPTRNSKQPIRPIDINSYLDGQKINYTRLLTDEVLAIDNLIVELAKKNMDVAGTTALIAILDDNKLTVANVGDSRGVMCDSKGNVIPLSFDHKPQLQRERHRIKKAGGFVTFNGVWRVAGILATSRALGDYPLKDRNLVIADPDILTFDLSDHDPMFLLLASDGLWDTFSNEEAVAFIRERLNEPYFGAKSISLQSFYRGSLDNITVVVINLKNHRYSISSLKKSV